MSTRAVALLLVATLLVPVAASSGGWTRTTFYPASSSGMYITTAALATAGGPPAAVFVDAWGNRVMYASDPLGGSGFVQVPLTILSTGTATAKLALEADGTPHVMVLRENGVTFALAYATIENGYWNVEPEVLTGPARAGPRLDALSLDASGRPHALFSVGGSDTILSRTVAGWTARVLGVGLGFPHMAADPSGTMHVCRMGPQGFVHAWGDPLGVWQEEILHVGVFEIIKCSIAAPGTEDVRIAYDAPTRLLHHAQKTAGGWTTTVLPAPFFGFEIPHTSVGTNATGASFVAARAGSFGGLRFYVQTPTGWVEETLPSYSGAASNPNTVAGTVRPYVWTGSASLEIWSWQ